MIRLLAPLIVALLSIAVLVLVVDEIDVGPVTPVHATVAAPPRWPSTTTTTTASMPTIVVARPELPRSHTTAPTKRLAGSIWDAVAACESGGRWDDTRGGYEGGLHFLNSTWIAAGGRRFAEHAYQATRDAQIIIAKAWLAHTSVKQWPVCGPRVGLTMADAA